MLTEIKNRKNYFRIYTVLFSLWLLESVLNKLYHTWENNKAEADQCNCAHIKTLACASSEIYSGKTMHSNEYSFFQNTSTCLNNSDRFRVFPFSSPLNHLPDSIEKWGEVKANDITEHR